MRLEGKAYSTHQVKHIVQIIFRLNEALVIMCDLMKQFTVVIRLIN